MTPHRCYALIVVSYLVYTSKAMNFANLTSVKQETSTLADDTEEIFPQGLANETSEFSRQIHFPEGGRKGWSAGWTPRKDPNKYGLGGTKNVNKNVGGGKKKHHPPYTYDDGTDVAIVVGRIVTCTRGETCHNYVKCASYPQNYLSFRDRCCFVQKQSKGMCCPPDYPTESGAEVIGNNFRPYVKTTTKVPDISENSLAAAARFGYSYSTKLKDVEVKLLELGNVVQKGSAAYGHLLFFQTTPETLQIARNNLLVVKACTYMQETYELTNEEAGVGLQEYSFSSTALGQTCPPNPPCGVSSRYRTLDGSCNNLQIPKLGQSTTPLLRLLPPDYADGVWAPRVRKDRRPLPNPRFVSRSLVPDVNQPDPRYSHLVMQFGQFIDHDLSHVPIFRLGDLSGVDCCKDSSGYGHPACFPIAIPPNDPYLEGECMNFVRSMIAPRITCDFGHADQLNQLTHWLDASQIYGNTADQGESLREFSGGLLRITRDPQGRHLLPLDLLDQEECAGSTGSSGLHCFIAGDKRVNEQIGLTSIHTIWVREHNRVATELSRINLDWDDQTLYQESRRIVIAEYQHIIYNEWLPIIVGRNYMEVFGILPLYKGYYQGYSASVDPTVSNAFTTAAFRLHTLIQGMLNLQNSGGGLVGSLNLRDFFNNPHLLREPGVIDLLNKGFVTQPIQRFDNFVTTELRDHLFQGENSAGMDLIALNIQRGRDHGLPSYNEYRDLCRLGKARDFADLQPVVSPRKIPLLEQIYESVDDIDLFIGGIFETPLEGALVGPTFVCIIGDQFVRAQKADRFFYSNGGEPHSFNSAQLHEIRGVSMSRILCDNSDEIRSIQPLAFHLPNEAYNPILPCGSPAIPRLDLSLWSE
ncbi:unnamed protein product [Allacma fusca]|uniref:Chorion peroxidase n=1 Tax=Allacma fusca TaxID=39272 RepID=A0A8J2P3S6_9HEXA|nr:unnamed protein product [Allacma fusca]